MQVQQYNILHLELKIVKNWLSKVMFIGSYIVIIVFFLSFGLEITPPKFVQINCNSYTLLKYERDKNFY